MAPPSPRRLLTPVSMLSNLLRALLLLHATSLLPSAQAAGTVIIGAAASDPFAPAPTLRRASTSEPAPATASAPSEPSLPFPDAGSLELSDDGTCGDGRTCLGYRGGQCCSEHFFCGNGYAYCGEGCQSEFGVCRMPTGAASSLRSSQTCPAVANVLRTSVLTSLTHLTTTTEVTVVYTSIETSRVVTTSTEFATATMTFTATATTHVTSTETTRVTSTETMHVTSTSTAAVTSTTMVRISSIVIVDQNARPLPINTAPPAQQPDVGRYSGPITVLRTETIVAGITGGAPAASRTVAAAMPYPTMLWSAADCKRWYQIQDKDTCDSIANASDVSLTNLLDLNLALGHGGNAIWCNPQFLLPLLRGVCRVNCDALWTGYWLCLGN